MNIWPVKRWVPEKSTRINYNWHKAVLQDKILPELEMVARAQAVYDMGMGIPPAARVIKDSLTGQEVVVMDDKDFYYESGWAARAIILKKPENLPEWVIKQCWDKDFFRNKLNQYVNQVATPPESRVAYWIGLKFIQSMQMRKSGPEAVLGLTQKILVGMYLTMADS